MFEKIFSFGGKKDEDENMGVNSETSDVPELKKPKTMEDVLTAKDELEGLKGQRKQKLNEYREKKDQVTTAGVAEFKNEDRPVARTETFNELLADTEKELAEISQKITEIRTDFDMKPNHVQRLTERKDRIDTYVESIRQKMAPEYRELKEKIIGFYGRTENIEQNVIKKIEVQGINIFLDSIKNKMNLPEIESFFTKIHGLNLYENKEKIAQEIVVLYRDIEGAIVDKTFYKTPAEEREAEEKIQRGAELSHKVYKMLQDARNKEGDFKNQKGYF